ncbi:MAG: hypothetical protein GC190_04975 [Alphaproteobacteria bacterium]|nr:hypothetical protein [Alphaproteobacteria bacterium]
MSATKTALCAITASLLASASAPALAASGDDLSAIRAEIKEMRRDYEHKIDSLEKRLRAAEAEAKAAKAAAVAAKAKTGALAATTTTSASAPVVLASAPPPPPAETPAPRPPASAASFNPAISAILNGSVSSIEHDPALAAVHGFALGDEAGLPDRGFSLNESEVAISANVDPELLANLIVSIDGDNQLSVEEAYIQTTALGNGFTVRGGRFFSSIGYLNEKHAHAWDFEDAPLPYRVFLNNQYGDDGVQVKWLAPTDFFLEFGAEWFRGDAFPAGNADDNGMGTVTAYVHSGGDIDEESSFLAGLSYLRTKADGRNTGGDMFSGTDDLGIASLVYKWAPNGNPVNTNLVLNGEYFLGHEDGQFNGVPVNYNRTGFYVQGAYQFMPRWRIALRYAQVQSDIDLPLALAGSTLDDFGHSPQATSAMLEYDTSEFGRLRLQYTYDQSDLQPNNEVVFQYTIAIGPHGAHTF